MFSFFFLKYDIMAIYNLTNPVIKGIPGAYLYYRRNFSSLIRGDFTKTSYTSMLLAFRGFHLFHHNLLANEEEVKAPYIFVVISPCLFSLYSFLSILTRYNCMQVGHKGSRSTRGVL